MSKFVQVSVSTFFDQRDATIGREYAAVDNDGRAWRGIDVGETVQWEAMPEHPGRTLRDDLLTGPDLDPPGPPELPDARTGTAARFWERVVEHVLGDGPEGRGSVRASDFASWVFDRIEEWERMYPVPPTPKEAGTVFHQIASVLVPDLHGESARPAFGGDAGQWVCQCGFSNHELRSTCRNCRAPKARQ